MAWPKTDDELWYIFEGQILLPVEVSTGAPILMLRPTGGVGQAIPAVDRGDPGKHAELSETITFTELTYDDPTPAGASFTTLIPPTDDTAGVYKLNLALHAGAPGADGTASIVPDDYGATPVAGQVLAVDAATTGFELVAQKTCGTHWPASFAAATNGDTNKTIATVVVPSYPFDYQVLVEAQTVITGAGSNVSVDLVARLGNETSGNDIGRAFGIGGTKDRLELCGAPPAGSAAGWNTVTAGSGTTVYLRTEKQSGSDNYSTSVSTTRCVVKVRPV